MTSITDSSISPQWFTTAVSNSNSSSYYLPNKSKSLDYSCTPLVTAKMASTSISSIKRSHKRPVKFDEARVIHQLEACDEAPETLWFSKQEIKGIRDHGRETLDKVKEAGGDLSALDEAMGESIRGLEHGLSVYDYNDGCWNGAISATENVNRKQRIKNIVSTILAQQEEQKDMGISDPKGLKQCSMACTQWAHDRALDLAKKDFDDAVQVWREDAECAKLLPDILSRKHQKRLTTRRVGVLSMSSPMASATTAEERRQTLNKISKTVVSALEELDDLEF